MSSLLFAKENIPFTEQELHYLKNKKELRVCIDEEWLPYEAIKNGKPIGIGGDFLQLVSQKLNLPIKIIDSKKNGLCELKPAYVKRLEESLSFKETHSYFDDMIALVTRIEQPYIYDIDILKKKKIVVVKGFERFEKIYPNLHFIKVQSIDEALHLVNSQKAFAYLGTLLESSYKIQKRFSTQLKIVNTFQNIKFGFGIAQNDKILLSLFNKTIDKLTLQEKQKIFNKWVVRTIVKEADNTKLWQLVGVFSVILIIILFFYNKQRKLKNLLELKVKERTNTLNKKNRLLKHLVKNFEELLDAAIETIIISDENHNILDINRSGLELFEVDKKEDVIGKSMLYFIPEDELYKVQKAFKKDFQEPYELRVKTVKNNFIDILAGGKYIDRDNITIRISTLINISNLKRKEKLLEQKTKEQDILLSLFDKGVSVLFKWRNDKDWSVEYVSKSVSSLLGYEQNDFTSNNIKYASCIHKDDLQRVTNEVTNASDLDKHFFRHESYRVITKSGDVKWVLDYTVIVKDINSAITHYLGYIIDITEQKQKQKQLLQQGKLAQMGDMISMIAHQWRQPLNAISATGINISLLSSMGMLEDKKVQESSEFIQNQCQNMSSTIDTFMNFVKPSQEEKEFTLEHSIDTVIDMMGTQLINHDIKVNILKNTTTTLLGHEDLLEQVIINILSNAKDAFEERDGEKHINITIDKRDSIAIIEIEDNAGGMEESVSERIFDPYYTTKEQGKGTGIGLYMSLDIMKKSFAGDIEYKATDFGSSFTLVFGTRK